LTLALWFADRSIPFYVQARTGRHLKPFRVIKFKTMRDARDDEGKLLPDEKRLTMLGTFVRRMSLDEIPQLLNVIAGEMSLVGPRPLVLDYVPLYSKEQLRRHEVSPGITGWAQVNGRNRIRWDEKFTYDVWYVDHMSFWLDMKILFLTFLKFFSATDEALVSAPRFNGRN
jgi:lipopolysaccharide/colanic/teichoic acid biosynthesis glycosyltransferase